MNDISYKDWHSMSDTSLAQFIGNFVKHNRLQQNKTQDIVANQSNISRSTLSLLEKGGNINMYSFLAVLRVLDLLYILDIFKIENQISPIQMANLEQKKKKRAGRILKINSINSNW